MGIKLSYQAQIALCKKKTSAQCGGLFVLEINFSTLKNSQKIDFVFFCRFLFTPVLYESFAYRRRRRGHCNAGFEQGFNFVVRRAGVPGDYRACVTHSSAFRGGAARYECSHRFLAVFFQPRGRFLFAVAVLFLCQTVNRSLLRIIS